MGDDAEAWVGQSIIECKLFNRLPGRPLQEEEEDA
jgi:hypothetical protein